jgi:hypothetical protein
VQFQAKETLIHILYAKLGDLVYKLMARIFKIDELISEKKCKTMDQLMNLNFNLIAKLELVDIPTDIAKYAESSKVIKSINFLKMNKYFRMMMILQSLEHLKKIITTKQPAFTTCFLY